MNFITEHILSIVTLLSIIVLVESLLRKEQGPTITLLWLFLIVLIPYVAIPIYLIFGARKIKKISEKNPNYTKEKKIPLERSNKITEMTQNLLQATGAPTLTSGNSVEIIDDGEKAFNLISERIRNAKTSISISTFIFKCDDVGKEIIKELIKKIKKDKIKIRILVDSVGSFYFHKILSQK